MMAAPIPRLDETVQFQDEIGTELDRICTSHQFRASRRSCEFLRHVVQVTLDGRTDLLKERSIGIDLLGRDISYDPSVDSTVRVRANDVRKRLGSYYSSAAEAGPVRIVLPPGTYIPQFVPVIAEAEAAPEKHGAWPWRHTSWLVACVLLVCISAGLLWRHLAYQDTCQTFWSQILGGKKVLLLSMSDEVRDRLGSGLYPLVWVSGHFGVPSVLTSGSLTGATTNSFAKARIAYVLPNDLQKDTRLHWLLSVSDRSQLFVRGSNGQLDPVEVNHAALVTRLPEGVPILYIQSTDQDVLRKLLETLTEREHFPKEIVPLTSRPLQVLLMLDAAGHATIQVWEPQH